MSEEIGSGWANPNITELRSKYHYFNNSNTSLCNRWGWHPISPKTLEQPHEDDICKQCKRRYESLKIQQGAK